MQVGDDDANEGSSSGECPGHDFSLERLVLVETPGRMIPGLGMEMVCSRCGTPAYEPSVQET